MIPLVVIRPEPGCAASVAAARDMGLAAQGFPLFSVRALPWDLPGPGGFDAILAGSANAFRHGGPGLAALTALPVLAVGEATAAAARAAGFAVARTGSGGLQAVLDEVPPPARLLRLAGAERIALRAHKGISMTERTVYESAALPMPDALAALLEGPAVVMLHSAEAARHFAEECTARGIERGQIALATIGARVSGAAGGGWRAVATAAHPGEAALLATARDLCQT